MVRDPDDWAELLGDFSVEQAVKVAAFAVAESEAGLRMHSSKGDRFIPPTELVDLSHIMISGGGYIVAFTLPGEDPCLQIIPRGESFELFLVGSCGGPSPNKLLESDAATAGR